MSSVCRKLNSPVTARKRESETQEITSVGKVKGQKRKRDVGRAREKTEPARENNRRETARGEGREGARQVTRRSGGGERIEIGARRSGGSAVHGGFATRTHVIR